MSQVKIVKFEDGEFHYKETYKYAHLVDMAIRRIGKDEIYLDEFKDVINLMIKRYELR